MSGSTSTFNPELSMAAQLRNTMRREFADQERRDATTHSLMTGLNATLRRLNITLDNFVTHENHTPDNNRGNATEARMESSLSNLQQQVANYLQRKQITDTTTDTATRMFREELLSTLRREFSILNHTMSELRHGFGLHMPSLGLGRNKRSLLRRAEQEVVQDLEKGGGRRAAISAAEHEAGAAAGATGIVGRGLSRVGRAIGPIGRTAVRGVGAAAGAFGLMDAHDTNAAIGARRASGQSIDFGESITGIGQSAASGALLGGSIGSFLGPAGTAIGGLIGGAGGALEAVMDQYNLSLKDALTKAVELSKQGLSQAVQIATPIAEELSKYVVEHSRRLLAGVGDFIKDHAPTWKQVHDALDTAAIDTGEAIGVVAKLAWEGITKTYDWLKSKAPTWGQIGDALSTAGGAAASVGADAIAAVAKLTWEGITKTYDWLKEKAPTWGQIGDALSTVGGDTGSLLRDTAAWIGGKEIEAVKGTWDWLKSKAPSWDKINDALNGITQGVEKTISDTLDWITNVTKEMFDSFWKYVKEKMTSGITSLGDIGRNIASGIGSIGSSIGGAVSGMFGGGSQNLADYSKASTPMIGKNFNETAPKVMQNLMHDFGLTQAQAAGIVGNLGHESMGFTTLQEQNPIGGGKGGYGWAQWTGPRRQEFFDWAKANNLDPNSDEANYGFLKHELSGKYSNVLQAVKNTTTSGDATSVFEKGYEGAGIINMRSRNSYTTEAQRAFNQVNNTTPVIDPNAPKVNFLNFDNNAMSGSLTPLAITPPATSTSGITNPTSSATATANLAPVDNVTRQPIVPTPAPPMQSDKNPVANPVPVSPHGNTSLVPSSMADIDSIPSLGVDNGLGYVNQGLMN